MKLTNDQLASLKRFQQLQGRSWKEALRFAWETCMYPVSCSAPALQQLRNILGPAWLRAYRVGDTAAGVLQYVPPAHIEPGRPNWRIVSAERSDPLTDLAAGYGTMKDARQYARDHKITLVEDRP